MPAYNSMFALWPGDWLNFSTFKPATFGYGGQRAASKAGHIANTNVGGNWAAPWTETCKPTDFGRQIQNINLLFPLTVFNAWTSYISADGGVKNYKRTENQKNKNAKGVWLK